MSDSLTTTLLTAGLLLLAVPTAATAQNPLGRQERVNAAPPFQGEFRGDGLTLTLSFDARTGSYAGSIVVDGERYECKGTENAGTLRGSFTAAGDAFAFTAVRKGDSLTLESDGAAHELRAVAAAPGLDPGGATANAGAVPEWLRPGVRITYWGGSRSMPGSAQSYVPDPDGNIQIGGDKYRLDDNEGFAGAGYSQYDVVDVDPAGVGVLMNNFVPVDAQLTTLTRTHLLGIQGDLERIGDFWIHPARLRAMPEEKSPTSLVRRVRYPLDGVDHDAITTQIAGPDGFIRNTYDLATGLLLVHTSSTTGKGGLAPAGQGYAAPTAGVTTIVNSRLVGVRTLGLPWAAQKVLPQWARPGQHMRYSGTYANSLGKGVVAPWRFDIDVGIERVVGGFAMAQMATRLDYGYGSEPQVSTSAVVYGAGMCGPLWIRPETLRDLRGGQVLDQDPVTRRRLRCVGSDGRTASILEEGPVDGIQYTYDLENGVLVGVAQRMQQGPATIDVQVQLVR